MKYSAKIEKIVSILGKHVNCFQSHRKFLNRNIKKNPTIIRNVRISDLYKLEKIEKLCWPKSRRTEPAMIKARVEIYPEGQFVLEMDSNVVGVIYSQRIKSKDELSSMRTETSWKFHDKTGSVIQLLGVSILPQYQGHGFGDELIEHLLNRCRALKDVTSFIGVSFCRNYHKQTEQNFEKYIYSKDKYGSVKDPVLRFHERHGGKVSGVLKGYRPDDHENEGNGILINYDIFSKEASKKIFQKEKSEALFLEQLVKNYLGSDKAIFYSETIPLMEMGLDSSDLLNLRDQLNSHYQVNLESIFFFEYNTVAKIKKYFKEQQIEIEEKELPEKTINELVQDSQKKSKKECLSDRYQIKQGNRNSNVAIIGMAFRLPGEINDEDSLLSFLKAGGSAIGSLPEGRWSWPDKISLSEYPGINQGGFLKDIANFDAEYFRISPKEAKLMDPQQRFLLELTWEVLERAGYCPSQLRQSYTGVFVGASGSDYQCVLDQNNIAAEGHSGLGNSMAILANRLSYFYDLRGPSLCIDTACSSSLVALYEAVEALKNGKCEQALVGGVHLMCHHNSSLAYYKAGMLSPDGLCRPFDEKANGYVRSEGAVVLLIKPLKKAIEDGDNIAAVIKGVACNHGGESSGLTVPNPKQQAALLKEACEEAGISSENISYIEAHGTGTSLGDPIEIRGIKEAYQANQSHKNYSERCIIGSVKSNFGHLEAAAGLAGLLKVVLSLQNKEIFKTVHFEKLNPHINLEGTSLSIAGRNQRWEVNEGNSRIAGVSSFGSGGTNAHAIIEEAKNGVFINHLPEVTKTNPALIVLSAKNKDRLKEYAKNLLIYIEKKKLKDKKSPHLSDIAYTLQVGREAMEERLGIIVNSREDLIEKLTKYIKGEEHIEIIYLGEEKKNKEMLPVFQTDKELLQAVHEWITEKNYYNILKCWTKGLKIDWNKIYGDQKPRKIILPTYPFAKEEYWIEKSALKIESPKVVDTFNRIPSYQSVLIPCSNLDSSEGDFDLNSATIFSTKSKVIKMEEYHTSIENIDIGDEKTRVLTPSVSDEKTLQFIKSILKEMLAKKLNMKSTALDEDKRFIDLGVDSIIGIRWIRTINEKYGLSLDVTKVYSSPTLQDLSKYVFNEGKAHGLFKGKENALSMIKQRTHGLIDRKFKKTTELKVPNNHHLHLGEQLNSERESTAIAIIGMSGLFPESRTLEDFWRNLSKGKNCISEIPKKRWSIEKYYDPNPKVSGKTYSKWMGVLEEADQFDPLFFNISPNEAEMMDPQQRLFLEACWNCIENAGYNTSSLFGKQWGVFVGCGMSDYLASLREEKLNAQGLMGLANSILGSRISYLLDLQGPNMAIDTACSSSLVAIAMACDSLIMKNSDAALAGGVYVMAGPNMHIMTSKAGMLSPDGKCKTFDQDANGFVPGEGVGVVLLKRLEDAIKDGDHIDGVIRGWGINQDGKTNGITAPNPEAQARLQRSIYDRFDIDPSTISLVEAHGTGTKLGDPIEVEALKQTFQSYTNRRNYCSLGSVKSNIGHLLAAAGVASVIKVLLSINKKQIPPTIHYNTLNEHILLEGSPFYVNTELRDWKVEDGEPRRAAVSSFGFSGTNAHLVIEEYLQKDREINHQLPEVDKTNPALILLSAKNGKRLKDYVQKLRAFIEENKEQEDRPGINLAEVAYTLQVGREAMEERLGIIASSTEDLLEKLTKYLEDEEYVDYLYVGQVKKNKEIVSDLELDEELQNTIKNWIKQKNYEKILKFWTKGLNIDWTKLYGDQKPQKISLPTYPFARERYWIDESETTSFNQVSGSKGAAYYLHPLIQQNTSTLSEQKFSSIFTGEEFFLCDHIVNGKKVLPGVAYLEMAREAVKQAIGDREAKIELKNIVWARPIIVSDESRRVHIGLFPEDNGNISYEIYTEKGNNDGETSEIIVHSQGVAVVLGATDQPTSRPNLDIEFLKSTYSQEALGSTECYKTFERMGLHYGPAHRGVEQIYVGTKKDSILAKLRLPDSVSATREEYELHPSLMDAALQASIGMMLHQGTFLEKPLLPFALQSLEVIAPCSENMWAVIKKSPEQVSDAVQKLDITLCDEQGKVCVVMNGFSSRVLDMSGNDKNIGSLILSPVWKEKATKPSQSLETTNLQTHIIRFDSNEAAFFEEQALHLFEQVKAVIESKPQEEHLFQVMIQDPLQFGLSGILKTAHLENPKIHGQVILINDIARLAQPLEEVLASNQAYLEDKEIWYEGDIRKVKELEELREPASNTIPPYKEKGIYLITGGAGGLGFIFAKDIIEKTKSATVVLTGRSELSPEKQSELISLQTLAQTTDSKVVYCQSDITNGSSLQELIKTIQNNHGVLTGIIHSAGIIKDNFILKKSKEEFLSVLSPKVQGTLNLDEATKEINLDFFVLFSSVAGVLGNLGQADYATGNAFIDAFAAERNKAVVTHERHGKTVSINWPLWKEGGMRIDAASEQMMRTKMGLIPMETGTGLRGFVQALTASSQDQFIIVEGVLKKIRELLLTQVSRPLVKSVTSTTTSEQSTASLKEKVEKMLMNSISKQLKIKTEDLDLETELSEYGFDSIILTDFANKLNHQYKIELTPTIFFEHPTIGSFATYLSQHEAGKLAPHFSKTFVVVQPYSKIEDESNTGTNLPDLLPMRKRSRFERSHQSHPSEPEPIAIIGMAGQFPMAGDIDSFWKNLEEGKDCISEIPTSRWDWKALWGDPNTEENKTNIKWGGFIEDTEQFDPLFFGISPREALLMDPQQRLLMEYVWLALEDAGYSAKSLSGTNTGIFIGTGSTGYSNLIERARIPIEGYSSTGMVPSVGPNRMSYFFNIHGPSQPIETACSSSLVAIHRAVEAIQSGGCEQAFVGGINTIVSPDSHVSFNKAGMLCEDGKCKTFSKDANGYVRGEGIGILFLKRLKDAEASGDRIYGVIRGSAENHGGRANSLTAPNPRAQADLIKTAYSKSNIDPRTVSYIEAHGTGTPLGDPIEINGLKTAFKELYETSGESEVVVCQEPHCGIGAVKTHIGHLELAAGVAGVIKVILQLQHKKLIKNLHCGEQNPYIDLKESPFYLVKENQDWLVFNDKNGNPLPRRASISSFGFGGSNAHVIVEEYIPQDDGRHQLPTVNESNPALVVLSAKNSERLKEYAQKLLAFLKENKDQEELSKINLGELAYTLQVGREAMEERLGIIASLTEDLLEKLTKYLAGEEHIEDLYLGQVKKNKETISLFETDDELQNALEGWIKKRKYSKLLEFWTKGLNIDWSKLYANQNNQKPRKISLPTYPFARERYWIEESTTTLTSSDKGTLGAQHSLHPLVQQNTSTLSEQKFSSIFTGEEFFLRDHIVNGQKVLPGVAYLEMAREAVKKAIGEREANLELKNIVWARPIIIEDQPKTVHIGLFPEENGNISYKIYTNNNQGNNFEPIVHSQGVAVVANTEGSTSPSDLDLKDLKLTHHDKEISLEKCYALFERMGLHYGPSHRGVEKIYLNQGRNSVLAKLQLPVSVSSTQVQFELHPSLMDSALQASIGIMINQDDNTQKPRLPFALQSLESLAPCTSSMWVMIKKSQDKINEAVQKLDITLCDEQGKICVMMKGFSSRALEAALDSQTPSNLKNRLLTISPVWESISIDPSLHLLDRSSKIVIIGGTLAQQKNIQSECPRARTIIIQPEDSIQEMAIAIGSESIDHLFCISPEPLLKQTTSDELITNQNQGVLFVFKLLKALLELEYGKKSFILTIITYDAQARSRNDKIDPTHAGLHGLIGSLAKEYPHWKIKLLDLEFDAPFSIKEILALPLNSKGDALLHRNGEWFEQRLIPVTPSSFSFSDDEKPVYRQGGVYVVIGGAGGIGEVWSQWVIKQCQAHVIWIGRREKNDTIQAKINSLGSSASFLEYIQADATNRDSLKRAYDKIKSKHYQIHGIIHSAIVLSDSTIGTMTEDQFKSSLVAKVDISVRIAQVFGKEDPDFFLFFSSIQSFMKAPGQSNYAAGCVFKDAFAQALSREIVTKIKVINWGYWGSIGVVATPYYQDLMNQAGIGSIEPEEGIEAIGTLMNGPFNQLGFIKTTGEKEQIEGVSTHEEMTIYPRTIPSVIEEFSKLTKEQEAILGTATKNSFKNEKIEEATLMEILSLRVLLATLKSLNLLSLNSLPSSLPPHYRLWLEESLRFIKDHQLLSEELSTSESTNLESLWQQWDQKKLNWMKDSNQKAQVILLDTCLRALPDILTQKCLPTDIIFPNSSMELVEGIYKGNAISDKFNEILANIVVDYVQQRIHHDFHAKLRLLEIGAGTGGTTDKLLPQLIPFQDNIDQYLYTDVSKAFLLHAQSKYVKKYSYVVPQLFDVAKSLSEQGIKLDSYDIIIATNVLHSTPNIRETIRNAKSALHQSGIIVINELSNQSWFAHLTFGLLKGWWLSEDKVLRIPGSPGLYPKTWKRVLEEEGFFSVSFPAEVLHDLGQQIVIGESDGVVKKRASPLTEVPVTPSLKSSIRNTLKINKDISTVKSVSTPLLHSGVSTHRLEEYVRKQIRESFAESLKIEDQKIEDDQNFLDYGVDSLIGIQLINTINKKLNVALKITALFDYTNVNFLTKHIYENYRSSLKIRANSKINDTGDG